MSASKKDIENHLIQALLDIESCAWGMPGYDTPEEAANWMNDRASQALSEACSYEQAMIVPDEPTDKMLEACMFSDIDKQYPENAKQYLRRVYKTMIKNFPSSHTKADESPKEQGQ